MTNASLAHAAHPNTLEEITGRLEEELERLRRARPGLASRIDKAEGIIVMQLSASNGYRPIKVRVRADGSRCYRVRSGGKLGKFYSVDPDSFGCDCPDAARRGKGCKHGIAAWALERAFCRPAPAVRCRQRRDANPLWGAAAAERLDEVASRLGV